MRTLIGAVFLLLTLQTGAQDYQPAKCTLATRWGKEVRPENAWKEYPRPQLQREAWMNLNGLWNYTVLEKGSAAPTAYEGRILVPFCIESALSGVGKALLPTQEIWYQRRFTLPAAWKGQEVLLHFDAVDFASRLWVNGKKVGEHQGGSDPFSFNITPFLRKNGEQEIVLAVWDPTDTGLQPRGKQSLDPKGIWYTAVSGIWQTVWMEPVQKTSIISLVPTADIDHNRVQFQISARGLTGQEQIHLTIRHRGMVVKDTVVPYAASFFLTLPTPFLWTPEHPELYTTTIQLKHGDRLTDQLETYFAMRKISLQTDAHGYQRLTLNNQPVFQYGTLDQGWWPDGLLTPPSDAAMLFDMVKLKEMGFNMIRKHIKVEPSRYYYHADTLGMLLWQDMPSGFSGFNTPSHVAAESTQDWVRPPASAQEFEKEWKSIMDHLRFFPSIVMWVPFNEGWGQYDTRRIAEWTKAYDPSRLVDAPSGWADRGAGDVMDAHQYPGPGMGLPSLNKGRAMVLGEFGGLGLVVKDHIWDPHKRNWGYKTYMEAPQLIAEYTELLHNMDLMIPRGLAAAVYTQTTDVEGEVNGLMTYDREVVKIPESILRRLHAPLYRQPEGRVSFINQTGETGPSHFKILEGRVSDGWLQEPRPDGFLEKGTTVMLKKGGALYAFEDFDIGEFPRGLGLRLYGFGDVRIYLNGRMIWQEDKVRTKRHYDDINLSDWIRYLKAGTNRIAVECTNATQDTPFDFSLYRVD